MPEQHYVTEDEIRTELDLTAVQLPDAQAQRLRRNAEVMIDRALPFATHTDGPAEGRAIDPADVPAYSYQRLQEATLALCKRLHERGPADDFESVSGPKFSRGKRIGAAYGEEVAALLDATGLRRAGARARA